MAWNRIKAIERINEEELKARIPQHASWHADYSHSAYVYVGSLPFVLTEGDIITVFSQFGEVVDCNLIRDKESGKSRGFAYVAFEDQRSTILAVDNLNGAELLERTLHVDHVKRYRKPKHLTADLSAGDTAGEGRVTNMMGDVIESDQTYEARRKRIWDFEKYRDESIALATGRDVNPSAQESNEQSHSHQKHSSEDHASSHSHSSDDRRKLMKKELKKLRKREKKERRKEERRLEKKQRKKERKQRKKHDEDAVIDEMVQVELERRGVEKSQRMKLDLELEKRILERKLRKQQVRQAEHLGREDLVSTADRLLQGPLLSSSGVISFHRSGGSRDEMAALMEIDRLKEAQKIEEKRARQKEADERKAEQRERMKEERRRNKSSFLQRDLLESVQKELEKKRLRKKRKLNEMSALPSQSGSKRRHRDC